MVKLFISSTSKDLFDHRQAVMEALHRSNATPIAMEYFGSRAEDATKVSLDEVSTADLFIGIYARRYGYRPDDDKSITEMEYIEARQRGIDRLVFIIADHYHDKLIDGFAETDAEAIMLLDGFKRRLGKNHVLVTFTTPQDLALKVVTSYSTWLQKRQKDISQTRASTTTIIGPNNRGPINGNLNIRGDYVAGDKNINQKPGGQDD